MGQSTKKSPIPLQALIDKYRNQLKSRQTDQLTDDAMHPREFAAYRETIEVVIADLVALQGD